MVMVPAWELSRRKKRKKMAKNTDKDLEGYGPDDNEYWVSMARAIGNPVPDYEDDSDLVDENGVFRGRPEDTK